MTRRLLPALALTALTAAALPGPASAQGDGAAYFPLEPGLTWTYRLTISREGDEKTIQYVARVARTERIGGAECRVVEHRSGDRLLQTTWYERDGELVRNPQRRNVQKKGRRTVELRAPGSDGEGRVLLDEAALAAGELEGLSWPWETDHGRGRVSVEGRETVRLPNLGELDCVVLVDEGTFEAGSRVAKQTRRFWLVPGIGMVKEESTFQVGDGPMTRTEAVLEHLPERT